MCLEHGNVLQAMLRQTQDASAGLRSMPPRGASYSTGNLAGLYNQVCTLNSNSLHTTAHPVALQPLRQEIHARGQPLA